MSTTLSVYLSESAKRDAAALVPTAAGDAGAAAQPLSFLW